AGLRATLAPFRASGLLPDYPLGSDFTALEQRLVKALEWLKQATATRRGKAATVAAALLHGGALEAKAAQRMELEQPRGIGEWLQARLLGLALRRVGDDN